MSKQCRKCRQFYLHEGIFGYCKKYETQALTIDNCKSIKELKQDSET